MSNRIQRVNSLLEHELSKILLKEFDFPEGIMVTLTRVETTGNLIEAKVYISVYPEDKNDEIFKILNKEVYDIQQKINKKLNMRPIPRIKFVKDENISQAGRVEELLHRIRDSN